MDSEPGAHIYMLRCSDGRYYVGSARLGLERRLAERNSGTYAGYTSKRLPVVLVWSEHFSILQMPLQSNARSKGGRAPRRRL